MNSFFQQSCKIRVLVSVSLQCFITKFLVAYLKIEVMASVFTNRYLFFLSYSLSFGNSSVFAAISKSFRYAEPLSPFLSLFVAAPCIQDTEPASPEQSSYSSTPDRFRGHSSIYFLVPFVQNYKVPCISDKCHFSA